jgi:hypothetical protein
MRVRACNQLGVDELLCEVQLEPLVRKIDAILFEMVRLKQSKLFSSSQ